MALPVKKIYIDSQFRTKDSISSSNFKFQLPESILLPHNTGMYIDNVSLPHAWWTIEPNINDKLYMRVSPLNPVPVNNGVVDVIITIASGYWNAQDLAAELQTKIRAATDFTVSGVTTNIFTVTYDFRKNIIIIASIPSRKFKILTPDDIATKLNGDWLGTNYDARNPQYFNEVLGQLEGTSPFYDSNNPYVSNGINLQPIRNVYLHSPNLGNYKTIGPIGQTTIIKKIPVTNSFNEYIFDSITSGNDYLDCSRQTLRTIQFYVTDSRGREINFHGNNFSFSIVFAKVDSDS